MTSNPETIVELKNLPDFISKNLSKSPNIYLLTGDLGSGKTTFTKHFLSYTGLDPNKITSPTYTLVQTYKTADLTIHHLDLYRLKNKEELDSINIDEILHDENSIRIIEWPELISDKIQNPHYKIQLAHTDSESKRNIVIKYCT